MRFVASITAIVAALAPPALAGVPAGPPVAAVKPVTDDYFGTRIVDPYRWMEREPQPQFGDYLHAENDWTRNVLARIPGRDGLARAIGALSGATARVRTVASAGGRIFYLKRDAGAQIDRLYVADATGRETLLVDPGPLGVAGKHAEIDQFAPSDDGRLVAYGISVGGSENSTLHVVETATGAVRADPLDRAQFASVSWAPDDKSFLFARLPVGAATARPDQQYAHLRVYRHVLGADPSADTVVLDADHLPFAFKAAATFPAIVTTPGSSYALATLSDGVSPELTIYAAPLADVTAGHPAWRLVVTQSDGVVQVAVRDGRIDLVTHRHASRFRVVETALAAPSFETGRTIVPQSTRVLTAIASASDGLYIAARDGAVFTLQRLANGSTRARTVALPFAGTVSEEGGLVTDPTAPGALVSLESWVRPQVWLRFDPARGRVADTHLLPPFPRDLSGYEDTETSAVAPDGTRIPLSIVTRKGLARDGRRPTYLVGYGAYGISYDPAFSPTFLPWLDQGGVYAIAHVRGGGERGQDWHDGGKIATKQNTIHDFIAAAETLVARGYTDAAHLGGEGTSAGGITIGGAITQRPDLFRAALIRVGSSNALREQYTAGGPANIPEFGDATRADQFPALLAMDAYNHVKPGVRYPAVLLTGGADDPRVTVWIPAKMTARLQANTASGRPVLFRVEFDAGHGFGTTRKQRDDETADELAFLLWQFGEAGFQPK